MSSPTQTNVAPEHRESAEADADAQALADKHQLEFRARHSLTIDAQAHMLLAPRYARELRAAPLGIEGGHTVVAIADPTEQRLEAIRTLTGRETKIVVVTGASLEALLKSRILSEGSDGDEASHAPPAPESQPASAPPGPQPAAPPTGADDAAIFDASNVTQLVEQLAAAADTLLALQGQVRGIATQFEQTRQELREQKEQLALAAAKADQDRARIRSVAASLAEDVARLDRTKADLAERLSGLVQED
jgi:type II secretion system (T2SS) protein E